MRRLSNEQFQAFVLENFSGTILVDGKYEQYRTRIACRCQICGNKWTPMAGNLIKGSGCPECGKQKAAKTKKWNITQEQFLSKIPPDFLKLVKINGTYSSQHCNIQVKCKQCNYEWISSPYKLYRKYGCIKCGHTRRATAASKTHQEFSKQIKQLHCNQLRLISKYISGSKPIDVRCMCCGHQWTCQQAARLLDNGCTNCQISKGERKIAFLLKNNNISFQQQYTFQDFKSTRGRPYRFDFAIFKNNILSHLIEYDGYQHFQPVKKWGGKKRFLRQQELDNMKNDYCANNSIKLIRIPYTEINTIDIVDLL